MKRGTEKQNDREINVTSLKILCISAVKICNHTAKGVVLLFKVGLDLTEIAQAIWAQNVPISDKKNPLKSSKETPVKSRHYS